MTTQVCTDSTNNVAKVGTGPALQESSLHQKRISRKQIKMQLTYHAQFKAEISLSGLESFQKLKSAEVRNVSCG